jgi:hypothetical protein
MTNFKRPIAGYGVTERVALCALALILIAASFPNLIAPFDPLRTGAGRLFPRRLGRTDFGADRGIRVGQIFDGAGDFGHFAGGGGGHGAGLVQRDTDPWPTCAQVARYSRQSVGIHLNSDSLRALGKAIAQQLGVIFGPKGPS